MITKETSKIFRGIAILIVIASHYAEWMGPENAVHPALAHAVSTWGPLGVDAFMLLSGYGLYKSAEKNGVNLKFAWRRLSACYIPYLITAAFLAVITHEVEPTNLRWLYVFFTAQDYWFISVLIVFYLAFMISFRLFKKLRIPVLSVMVLAHTIWLYLSGHADFWTMSNAAFLFGVYAAAAEKRFKGFSSLKSRLIMLALGGAGSVAAFYWMQKQGGSGLAEAYIPELILNLFLPLLWLACASLFPRMHPLILGLLGEHSIFIYLTHNILFIWIYYKLPAWPFAQGCMLTAFLSLVIACVISKLYLLLGKGCGNLMKMIKEKRGMEK